MEVDFAMLMQRESWAQPDTTVVLGECKTFGDFRTEDVERMAQVGQMFPGCALAFATMKEHFNSDEQKFLSEFAAVGRESGELCGIGSDQVGIDRVASLPVRLAS